MFYEARDFTKDVTGWNVCNVANFDDMFRGSGQPNTTLVPPANGECIACPEGYNSGSGEYVDGGNTCTPILPCLDDITFRKALDLWFSNSTLATSTYGNITDWCTRDVTDMSTAFKYKRAFNEDISGWDVSSVTDMSDMFG